MKRNTVAVENFDFDGFVKAVLKFLEPQVGCHPSYAIVMVAGSGEAPEYGPEEGRTSFKFELGLGQCLFFPFSSSNMDEPIPCADGKTRKIAPNAKFRFGEVDCVGFLIGLNDGKFQIDSALHAGGACTWPPPSVDVMDCGVFDRAMASFIQRFIRA